MILKTEKLFHKDSYQNTFQAHIVEKYTDNGRYALVLNKTCFYPSSGGQICDRGIIEGISVIDVIEIDGKIIHYLEKEVMVETGGLITGTIDCLYRFDHMQQHTGQHILSGALMKLWGKDTQSFHMGNDICTLDIPYTNFDEYKITELEDIANKIIYENKIIHNYFVKNSDELMEKSVFRIKQEHFEELRIIEIDGFDLSACGGTHCGRTGEVGVVKIIGWENRKDRTRISFLCGNRAFTDYQKKHNIIKNLTQYFTTGTEYLENKIMKLNQEQKELSKLCNKMEREIIEWESEKLKKINRREEKGITIIEKLFPEQKIQNIRQIAMLIVKEGNTIVVLGTKKPEPLICIARSYDLNNNIKDIFNQIMTEFNGKGGGSENIVLGILEAEGDIEKAYKRAVQLILS